MLKHKLAVPLLIGSLALGPLVGCENIDADPEVQGAVIGGLGGAVAGGAISEDNRLLGALIGGAIGAGGGYLIGSQLDKSDRGHSHEARRANERAREYPVTPAEARRANTADVNNDGYVTMDEVVAMSEAGLGDRDMIERLERTNQFYELTPQQEDYLRQRGVSNRVIVAMRTINSDIRDEAYARSRQSGGYTPYPR